MQMAQRDASRIAREWMDQQADLPEGRFIHSRKYDHGVGGRSFTVLLKERTSGNVFLLVKLYVCDDASVKVHLDRRAHVRQLFAASEICFDDITSNEAYDHPSAVRSFLEATQVRTNDTPSWLRGIRAVHASTVKGSKDAYADIDVLDSSGVAEVPIKIVATRSMKTRHNRQLSVHKQEQQIVLVITKERRAVEIREQLYYYLNEMRIKRIYR